MNEPAKFFDVPTLRYIGAKWKLADWIIGQFPPHELYCEPFCGSAAIFFRKPISPIEVLNDAYGDLVNFFRILRERPDDLIHQIQLTPFSREEYELAYEPADDSLERARRFYVLCWQSFGAYSGKKSGWRVQKNTGRGTRITREWKRIAGLRYGADRLLDAQIENKDAVDVIRYFDSPTTLFYVDPPYVKSARSEGSRSRYEHEMNDADHRRLAEVLHQVDGMVVLSGYDSALYQELFGDWRCFSKTTTTNGNSTAIEYVWVSPKVDEQWRLYREQLQEQELPLFRTIKA